MLHTHTEHSYSVWKANQTDRWSDIQAYTPLVCSLWKSVAGHRGLTSRLTATAPFLSVSSRSVFKNILVHHLLSQPFLST